MSDFDEILDYEGIGWVGLVNSAVVDSESMILDSSGTLSYPRIHAGFVISGYA